jgi:Luciferase-like monooxygenase
VLAAKMLATVDVLSKGRLTVGVGVGWMSEEIALLGGPPFAERAQASEEYIQAVRELWTAEKPVQQGPYAAFHKLLFAPKSPQLPHAPIWLGGEVEGARQLYGDALAGVRAEAERLAILVRLWAQFSPFTAVSEPSSKVEGGRLAFTASVQAIVDDIGHLQERGMQYCVIGGDGKDLQGTLELLGRFASEVMAKCD